MAKVKKLLLILLSCFSVTCAQAGSIPFPEVIDFNGPYDFLSIQGEVLEAKAWMDSGDSTILVISEVQNGELYGKDYRSEILGYRFSKRQGKWSLVWSIKEFNQSSNEVVWYHKGSIRIKDVDGKGGDETLFFYSVGLDGETEPLTLKMIFHWNGVKSPVRGKIPRESGHESLYEKNLDPMLKTAPKVVREYAIKNWKSYVNSHYRELIGRP